MALLEDINDVMVRLKAGQVVGRFVVRMA